MMDQGEHPEGTGREQGFDLPPVMTNPSLNFLFYLRNLIRFTLHLPLIRRLMEESRGSRIEPLRTSMHDLIVPTSSPSAPLWFSLHESLVLQFTLQAMVDNFFTYLWQLIQLIVTSPSEASTGVREGSRDHRDDSLLVGRTQGTLHDLSWQGLPAISHYLSEEFGLEMFRDSEELNTAAALFETRNVVIRSRGHVDHTFLRKHPDPKYIDVAGNEQPYQLGDPLRHAEIPTALFFLPAVTLRLDGNAAQKFNLPVADIPPDLRTFFS